MTDHLFQYVSQRCFLKPLLIEESKAIAISHYLERRLGMSNIPSPEQYIKEGEDINPGGNMVFKERPVISGRVEDVVVIPIIGTLVNRQGSMDAASGMISHRSIRNEIVAAANDKTVKSIILDIDSGGGEVEGNFDLGRLIRQINDEVKPVIAIANGDAFSGAFSLGVSAGKFFMTETGGVGSVGVIIQHVDFSEANEAMGIKVTNIKFGQDKDMFSPDFPLSPEAKSILQAEVDRTGKMFVDHVSQMRDISAKTVINTEAALLFGEKAASINFVDGITSFDALLEDVVNTEFPIGPIETKRISQMFVKKQKIKIEDSVEDKIESPDPSIENEAPVDKGGSTPQDPMIDPVERAAEISSLCIEANIADMSPSFIRSSMTIEQVKEKIDADTQISQTCVLAGKPDRATAFISNGTPLKEVQDTLISEASADQEGSEVSPQESPEKMQKDVEAARQGNVILADVKKRQEIAKAKGVS